VVGHAGTFFSAVLWPEAFQGWNRLGPFREILATLVLFAFIFCVGLYFKGAIGPAQKMPACPVTSSGIITGAWSCTPGYWSQPEAADQLPLEHDGVGVIICSFAAKQAELDPAGTSAMGC